MAASPVFLTLEDDESEPEQLAQPPSKFTLLYPEWDFLPQEVKLVLNKIPTPRLWDAAGLLSFRYGSPAVKEKLILGALRELRLKVDSARDHSVVASYLSNYFSHSVGLYLRREGDLQTRDLYVADERHHVHRLVSTADALQTVCDTMQYLIDVIDAKLLHGNSPSSQRSEIDCLKEELKRCSAAGKKGEIKEEVEKALKTLALRSMFTSNATKLCIAREFLQKVTANCLKRGIYAVLCQDTNWLPMANGYDVNLETLETRRRYLDHHIVGVTNAVFTIPLEDVKRPKLSEEDRRRLFGAIPTLINQLAANNPARAQAIIVSIYLQLLGHNKHKYLIIYEGDGHNGKSFLVTLLRETLGELCAPLHKSILFGGKETSSHSGFQIQLESIRSGFMDDLGPRDEFNEQAVKTIVSPDVELVMREAGHTRRGAAKARYRVGCSVVLCCNKGSMPKIRVDNAIVNRFRILPFVGIFLPQEPTAEQKASGKAYYRAQPNLLDELKKPEELSKFFNYILMAGRYYYHRNIKLYGEPLVNEPQVQAELLAMTAASEGPSSSISSRTFEEWWETQVQYRPGESVPIVTLAASYSKFSGRQFSDEAKEFGQLLQTHYPLIVQDKKKQLMTTVMGIRAKRMTVIDYQLYDSPVKEELEISELCELDY